MPAQVILNHFLSIDNKFFFDKHEIYITLGNTNNNLKEHEEKFYFPDIIMNLNNSLYNFKWRFKKNKRIETIFGSQGMYQLNQNGKDATEILIPDSKTTDLGGYGLFKYKLEKYHFLIGARLDRRWINTTENFFNKDYIGYNYSVGFARLGDKTTTRLNVSSGFRAPNTSELLSDGIHHGSLRYEIGNVDLKTEKAIQIDASLAIHLEDFEFIVNPFYNYVSDYIFIQQMDSIINGFQVYGYQQIPNAQLYGIDAGVHFHPHRAHWLHFSSSFSSVFAEDLSKNPLPLIPQTRLYNQIKFEINSKNKFRLTNATIQYQYFFKQNRIGLLETETADFHLINFGVNMVYGFNKPLFISFGVKNALNTAYIDHLSQLKSLGIPNPGINIYCSLKYQLKHKLN